MNIAKPIIASVCILSITLACLLPRSRAAAAESSGVYPAVIQNGLSTYTRAGTAPAFETWRLGGLLENDRQAGQSADRFELITKSLGAYRSDELIQTKEIGQSSKSVYLAVKFQRGVLYMSFLVFRGDKDWVVQNMEFSTKPDLIMPWLVTESGK